MLFLLVLHLVALVGCFGGWAVLEHPRCRYQDPFPSIFETQILLEVKSFLNATFALLDQCRLGAPSRKPTQLFLHSSSCNLVHKLFCNHERGAHKVLSGLDDLGNFKTTPASEYPSQMNSILAQMFLETFQNGIFHGHSNCFPKLDEKCEI